MKQTAILSKGKTFEFDDEAPCQICGQPIASISMNGPTICPWCDLGRCRYCKDVFFVLKEHLDGGQSKRELRQHMRQHEKEEPEFNKNLLDVRRRIREKMKIWRQEKKHGAKKNQR